MARRGTGLFLKLLAVGAVCLGLAAYAVAKGANKEGPLAEAKTVVIPKGAGSRRVAEILEREGVAANPYIFMIAGRFTGLDRQLRAGEYRFEPRVSAMEAMRKIAKGEVVYHRITLPEGFTTGKLLYLISQEEALEGEVSIDVAEGGLLPETYTFERGTARDAIVKQAMQAMRAAAAAAWENRAADLPVKTPEQLVVLASIIERETAVAAERGLVASVFSNRLKKGMKLQTDPTVIYALTGGIHDLGRTLRKVDLAYESPYNTYLYYGLPPGPISNPSRESLAAAANPEFSEYLYFVADGLGGHNFSKSLNEHNANVQNWKKGLHSAD